MAKELPPGIPETGPAEKSGMDKLRRNIILGIVGLFALLLVFFIIALVLSIAGGESFAEAVRVIRDLVIIFLVLEGVLIILSLAILILQISRLVNLLQTEVKPMIDNTQSTLTTVRGTVEFMSDNLTQPIVRAGGLLAALSVMISNLFGIRRALKHAETKEITHAK